MDMMRRLLERFALIAFGLYHVPLFLNNYPSLGGGGFNDTGLAPRWGHMFTVPGIWVARHLFGMTGPMPGANAGDNGDVGEEFARLLLAVVIGAIGAVVWTMADRKRPRSNWVEGTLKLLLRYSIALGLASYAVAKLFPQQFPPLAASALEVRLGDLTPMGLLWNFMQYSRPYAFFGGVMELAAVVLLCFRRTATLGALVCLAVMTNVALLNLAYGVQVKLYALMIVASAAVLVLYDAPRLFAMFVRNAPVPAAALTPDVQDRIPGGLRWTIKVALVGSVLVSSVVVMEPASPEPSGPAAAIDGAWVVTAFARDGQPLETTGNPARWRRLIVENGLVAIRFESDTLARCRRTPSPPPSALKFACSRNRAGELNWTRNGEVVQLEGTFDGAKVTATGHYVNRSDYPLWRSQFRWIYDR
jgi:hypothetical protein